MDGSSMPKPAWLGIAILGPRIWRSRPHFQSQNLGTECWSSKSQDFGIEKQDLGLLNWLHKDITNNYNFTLILVFLHVILFTHGTHCRYMYGLQVSFSLCLTIGLVRNHHAADQWIRHWTHNAHIIGFTVVNPICWNPVILAGFQDYKFLNTEFGDWKNRSRTAILSSIRLVIMTQYWLVMETWTNTHTRARERHLYTKNAR